MRLLISIFMVLLAAVLGAAYFYIWPNLSGNWVNKMNREHPELLLSLFKLGDKISRLPRPLVPIDGSPNNPTLASCSYYTEHVDGLPEPCKHKANNGLVYESNGDSIEGVILRLDNGAILKPLPFGIIPSETANNIVARFNKLGLKADVIFEHVDKSPRLIGWKISEADYEIDTRFAWVEFEEDKSIRAIGVSMIYFD